VSTVYDDWGTPTHADNDARQPATAAEVWAAVRGDVTGDEARSVIASYLAPGPQPRYDTPQARAEAQADREAGG
jgi:hypothetical protein